MKLTAAVAIGCLVLEAQSVPAPSVTVMGVRHANQSGVTRVTIEISGAFTYKTDRLHNPERVYYDFPNSKPTIGGKHFYSEDVTDGFLRRVRVAETQPNVTRVVLDLSGAPGISVSQSSNPDRLTVDLRPNAAISAAALPASLPAAIPPVDISKAPRTETAKVAPPLPPPASPRAEPVRVESIRDEVIAAAEPVAFTTPPTTAAPIVPPPPPPAEADPGPEAKPARRMMEGGTTLTRTLGLKVRRVVIDAGHGGHDQGTEGAHGLQEKELVLDVALRLGKLIQSEMGSEVIFTRSDDTFIPLEGRTAFANEHKADLFLSIHANSSPSAPQIAGAETYYLNFTDNKDSMAVATRENATSEKSIFDLRDIIQAISMHDKLAESRDFAAHVQSALYAFTSRNFANEKNRGVKKAEFVVLVGANMPSVLAEIGFLSNSKEEALLKKPEYRQKLAESICHGVSKYADSLSHFQVAKK